MVRRLRDLFFCGGLAEGDGLTVFEDVGSAVWTLLGDGGTRGTFCGGIEGVDGVAGDPDTGPRGTPALFGAAGLFEPGRKAGSLLRMPGLESAAKVLRGTLRNTP